MIVQVWPIWFRTFLLKLTVVERVDLINARWSIVEGGRSTALVRVLAHFEPNFLWQANDHGSDPEKFKEDLMNIARTTLSSKILSAYKDFFAKMAVDAVLRLKKSGNLDAIQIIKVKGGSLEDSFLDEGMAAAP